MSDEYRSVDLIEGWRTAVTGEAPYLFPGDEFLLGSECSGEVVSYTSFDAFIGSDDFDIRARRELHLGLIPMPYMGSLSTAKVFVLLSNPGLGPADYFAEDRQPDYRDRLLANLHQENDAHDYPFLFLDPRFSWHAGFAWWESKLHDLAEAAQQQQSCSYQDALRFLASTVAAIEYVPYHSTQFGFVRAVHGRMASTRAAKSYVHDVVVPRAAHGDALIVVTRGNGYWQVPEQPGVVVYGGGETRGASLSLNSRGGRAIADVLSL